MTEGARLLHDAAVRAIVHMGDVGTLRRIHEAGLAASTSVLAGETSALMGSMLKNPELAAWAGAPPGGPDAEFLAELGRRTAADTAKRAAQVVEAAELVLYHSLTDGIASDCCRAITLLDAGRCSRFVDRDEVMLERVRESGYSTIVAEALVSYAKKLQNRSLPNRISWLLRACPPRTPLELLPAYKYDGARMNRLDLCRHEVVHGRGVRAVTDVHKGDSEYLLQTAFFLAHHVRESLGVPLNTDYTSKAIQAWLKPL